MISTISAMLLLSVLSHTSHAVDMKTSTLELPRSQTDVQKVMAPQKSSCTGCGVVTNVRQLSASRVPGMADRGAADARIGDVGPGDDIKPVTIIGTNDQSRQGRSEAAAKSTPAKWEITVRYDDGSYASFDQVEKPHVVKGQRVQVHAGRVKPK